MTICWSDVEFLRTAMFFLLVFLQDTSHLLKKLTRIEGYQLLRHCQDSWHIHPAVKTVMMTHDLIIKHVSILSLCLVPGCQSCAHCILMPVSSRVSVTVITAILYPIKLNLWPSTLLAGLRPLPVNDTLIREMANRTAKDAKSIKGTNPQYLVEKIIRTRIYDSKYWKEECFGLTGEVPKANKFSRGPSAKVSIVMKL